MDLVNTTKFSDRFLRRMVSWCCKYLGHPIKLVKRATFCNRTYGGGCNGRAWHRSRFLVRVGPDKCYPMAWNHRGVELTLQDQMACIVYVTGHELQHLKNWHVGIDADLRGARDLEPHCVRQGKRVMLAFEQDREALLAAWSKEPERMAADKGPRDVVAERAAKVQADLARWQRKLKLATTKVKKLKRKVAYYERKTSGDKLE